MLKPTIFLHSENNEAYGHWVENSPCVLIKQRAVKYKGGKDSINQRIKNTSQEVILRYFVFRDKSIRHDG